MSERRKHIRKALSNFVLPEEDYHHIIYEKRTEIQCTHSLEFWVAVQTVDRNDAPIIIQWCMRCQATEVLSWEEYQIRKMCSEEQLPDREMGKDDGQWSVDSSQ